MRHSHTRGDNERAAGTLEYGANGFNGAFVELAAFRESRPVVPEGYVKDGVGRSGATAEAFQIFQVAAMDISPGCSQKLDTRIAASKTEHLVARADQFRDDPGTYETCCTCYKDSHRNFP